ncbi:hypothetical protein BGZ89_011795, partial [Linnemannia elongata]
MSILAEEQKVLFGKGYNLLAMNHTRWNSKYVTIVRVVKVSPAFEKAYRWMLAAHNEQRANSLSLKKLIPSGEEIAILNELIRLLQGAANFTHWVGQLENPTVSQVYPRIEGILPAIDTFTTDGPREMHQQLEKELRQTWSHETIPDSILVAMFLAQPMESSICGIRRSPPMHVSPRPSRNHSLTGGGRPTLCPGPSGSPSIDSKPPEEIPSRAHSNIAQTKDECRNDRAGLL